MPYRHVPDRRRNAGSRPPERPRRRGQGRARAPLSGRDRFGLVGYQLRDGPRRSVGDSAASFARTPQFGALGLDRPHLYILRARGPPRRSAIGRERSLLGDGARRQLPRRLLDQVELGKFAIQLGRSEEHTSELQSLMRISYAVFCLKKKNKKTIT